MRPVVYLGPSLSLDRARRLLDADYRPPIRRGDLSQDCQGTVVIIDGEFAQNLSVSPNEILRLLDGGTRVLGASSMGALRAAELYPFGMQGCGWVFEAYRSGKLLADDEVAVSYSPFDAMTCTVPLVNVRVWLDRLVDGGHTDLRTARLLLSRARRLFYADRTEERLRREWESIIGPVEMARLLNITGGIADIKAEDAELALSIVAGALPCDAIACQEEN